LTRRKPTVTFSTSRFNIADVARWTYALHNVIVNVAVHVTGARVLRARILAMIVDASLVRRAIRVASTSQQHAGNPRVTAEARWAFTDGLVIYAMAHGVLATGGQRRRTYRHAVALDARVRTAAIAIGPTPCN
jgi:hypothetical protein